MSNLHFGLNDDSEGNGFSFTSQGASGTAAALPGSTSAFGTGIESYVSPYPTFQLETSAIIMSEGNPGAGDTPTAVDVLFKISNLKTTAAMSWWVTSDEPVPYWSTLPSGTLEVTANGTFTFNALTYQPDTTPGLDTTFTLHFYPAGGITMAGYGDVTITILDDDSPYNGDGNDNVITASAGSDVVNARAGNDIVHAGAGDDKISGGDGNDTIYAGYGNDYVRGDAGDDTLYGGGGNDTLLGGDGNDTISGGTGNDFIAGGAGANVMTGGAGADTFYFDQYFTLSSGNRITDFVHGTDHIEISLAAWHLTGAPAFENANAPTMDTPELYFSAATHTLYYAPYGGTDDGTPSVAYAIAHLDNVAALGKADFIFI